MKKRKGFTLIELLVVIAIIALLLSILLPSLKKVKKQAQTVVCQSNLKQFGVIWGMYTSDHNDKFVDGSENGGEDWPQVLRDYYGSFGDFRCCPAASKARNEDNSNFNPGGTFEAWGPWPDNCEFWQVPGDYGSYALNLYICSMSKMWDEGIGDLDEFWQKTTRIKGSEISNVPLMMDSLWVGIYTQGVPLPPPFEPVTYGPGLDNACIPRHSENINSLFADLSARKVGLKELWTLKWYRSFDTRNIWTLAGNDGDERTVTNIWEDKAPWMAGMKNY